MAHELECETFDYENLSRILRLEASFFDKITALGQPRSEPQYYRVAYYGATFPDSVRNREFIYRGKKQEFISVFCERIRLAFPAANIAMKVKPATEEMKSGPDQTIMICKVG